jgi:hypothetical protein
MATQKTPLMPDIFSTEKRVAFDGGHVDVFQDDGPESSEKKPPKPRRKKPAAKKATRKKK